MEVDESEKKEDKTAFKKVELFVINLTFWNSSIQASEVKKSDKHSQYTPLDEAENQEVNRTHKLDSARVFFYQGEKECDDNMQTFINCIDAVKGIGDESLKVYKSYQTFSNELFYFDW